MGNLLGVSGVGIRRGGIALILGADGEMGDDI